jgi:aminoglycoside phosphotransferase (APT) family kinase protein
MTDDGPDGYLARLVDEDRLRAYLADRLGPADTFAVERHPEGHSNETLFVTWGDRELVLRRPPPGETAETAHDVLREYRVISALQGTDVPVPATVLSCEDHSVLGCDFYAVERLAGDVIRDPEPDRFGTLDHRRALGECLVEILARIQGVDYDRVGLGEFGYPEGFAERQVDRWTEQLDWAFEHTGAVRAVPALREVGDWLAANVPDETGDALVHGDYKLDNVMVAPGMPPRIVGVFDWELSTLGDPLTDLGWLLFFWHDRGEDPPVPELQPTFLTRAGYPTRRELVDRYEAATGTTFANGRFYRALAAYKMAGLGEMFFRRHLEGNSDDPLYPKMEERVPALAAYARRVIDGEDPLRE